MQPGRCGGRLLRRAPLAQDCCRLAAASGDLSSPGRRSSAITATSAIGMPLLRRLLCLLRLGGARLLYDLQLILRLDFRVRPAALLLLLALPCQRAGPEARATLALPPAAACR